MARLLVKNNRLAVRNGRLVTTAGGAPCCCGEPGPCGCDPSLPIITDRVVYQCNGVGVPSTPVTLPPHRVETLRVEFLYADNSYQQQASGNTNEGGISWGGTAVYCKLGAGAYGLVEFAYDIFQFQRVTTTPELNFEYAARWESPAIPTRRGGGACSPLFARECPLLYVEPIALSPGLANDCQTFERTNFDGIPGLSGYVQRSFLLTQRVDGGESIRNDEELRLEQVAGGTRRTEISTRHTIRWTRTLDLCEGGSGDVPNRPGNCAGCGDPSRLTIV
jgi:hypothetical protein